MAKQFKNVADLIKGVSEGDDFKKEAVKKISENGLGKFLAFLRCDHRLTQGELAAKMGCSQGRISKIESANDDKLSIKDFLDYGKALGLELEVGFRSKNTRYVDMVKFHAFQMQKYLTLIADLANEDAALEAGVLNFHVEALVNARRMILDSMAKVEKSRVNRIIKSIPGQVHISGPVQHEAVLQAEVAAV
ncbi:MAG: helix-turn-helix transcriptional regulator [Candidatus Omnitrophota bacterium]